MGETWFISDLHLGHAKIVELASRPFASVEEMNAALIRNWQEVVAPEDDVWCLGDMVMGQLAENLPLLAQLPGKKHLVLGNHDRPSKLYHHKSEEKRMEWVCKYEQYFVSMQEEACLEIAGTEILLSHLPYNDPEFVDHSYEDRYSEYMPKDQGLWLVHGHVHEAWKVKNRQINVGVDVWDFRPVPLSSIMQIMSQTV